MVSIIRGSAAVLSLIDPTEEFVTIAEGFRFTEGPIWNPRTAALLFSDIQGDARWRWTAATGAQLVARPNWIGNGMTYEPDGSILLCEHVTSSVVRLLPDGTREVVAFHFEGTYLNSPNDVVRRSDGTVYFSDPDYGRWDHAVGVARKFELGFQGLFRVRPGGEVELAAERDRFDQPNGLCFSPDESVLYVDDLDGITAFDVDAEGVLHDARVIHSAMGDTDIPGKGNPDGMKCDALGNIWCTAKDGIWIISPSGDLLGIIETPETSANLTWGGDDWMTLFVCTSSTVRTLRTLVPSAPLARPFGAADGAH